MANEIKGGVNNTTGIEVSDLNANGILDLTTAEITQIANIGTVTITAGQWGYLGATDQALATTDTVQFASLNINGAYTLPTADGSANQVLKTNGTGTVTWQTDTTVNYWNRVTGTPNYVIPVTAADDVGATGARITKGWFTDIESTNMPTVGGTSINANGVLDLTSGEVTQLANIGAETISAAQWGYLGALDQGLTTTSNATFADLTLTGDIKLKVYTDAVSNPPTDAELDLIFGTPITVGAGFSAIIDDGGTGTNVYQITTNGTNWYYTLMAKAV